jgi:hypothetical protein
LGDLACAAEIEAGRFDISRLSIESVEPAMDHISRLYWYLFSKLISKPYNPIDSHDKAVGMAAPAPPSPRDLQIAEFITANDLSPESLISFSIDAMSMTSDEHYLPAQDCDHAFLFSAQPLDHRLKCMPLHVMNLPSGQATEQVQAVIETVCDALSSHGVNIKYVCVDGDPGYNQPHSHFFWNGIRY